MNFQKGRRTAGLFLIHLFIAGLGVTYSCGVSDTIGHGPFYLIVPTSEGVYQDHVKVKFFLDEEVEYGTMIGWVRAAGCVVWVDLCDDGRCETIFTDYVYQGEEVMFELDSDDSVVFDNFLEEFELCYKGGEMWQEPMSCQNWSCEHSEDDIMVLFESECPASLQTELEVRYFDERTPFKGPLYACAYL